MERIDDYDLYDQDFPEWLKRGREAYGLPDEEQACTNDLTSIIYINPINITKG